MKESRSSELEVLKIKILDAIKTSKQFWMTFREGTYGLASIINLIYKKSYIEVLFFPHTDIQSGIPELKIYSPLGDEVNFDEIIINPDIDEDGFISPQKIIQRMRRLLQKEFRERIARLEYELSLIDERYENYIINNNPYDREIRISYKDFTIPLRIDFNKYPALPLISFSKMLSKIISEREISENIIIRKWDVNNPPHVISIINIVSDIISKRLKLPLLEENSQQLIVENVSIGKSINSLSFKVHRGTSIGILNDEELMEDAEYQLDLLNLFEAIAGNNPDFSGSISIFNEQISEVNPKTKKKLFVLPQAFDTRITNLKIRKALLSNINMEEIVLDRKKIFEETLKEAGIYQRFDELIKSYYEERPIPLLRTKKEIINNTLEATGLFIKTHKKFNDLTPLEFLLFSIAYALAQDAIIIMFSIPLGILDKLEYEKFNNYMEKIKRDFHIILIFHGPEEIISKCDKILTITKNATKIGTFEDYIEELPQFGEILTIELNNPNPSHLSQLKELNEIDIIIEERKNEKYRIFLKMNTKDVIIKITELLGSSLFSFRRRIATIKDYLEFTEQKLEVL